MRIAPASEGPLADLAGLGELGSDRRSEHGDRDPALRFPAGVRGDGRRPGTGLGARRGGLEVLSLGRRLDLIKRVAARRAGGGVWPVSLERPAGDRPYPDVHREPDRPEPLPALLGRTECPTWRRSTTVTSPTTINSAAASSRRRDVLHRQRFRGDRRLPPLATGAGTQPPRGHGRLGHATWMGPTATWSRRRKGWGSSAIASASSR